MADFPLLERRSFLSRLTAAAAALGLGTRAEAAQETPAPKRESFQPVRHSQDDWFDERPAKHRIFFDTLSASGVADAIHFAVNFLDNTKSGYGLEDNDLSVIVCLRHAATNFAWTDAMWAKYGGPLSDLTKLKDPKTNDAPTRNLYNTTDFRSAAAGVTLDMLVQRGVRYAVCNSATRNYSRAIARRLDLTQEEVYKDLTAHTIEHSRFVPAGIVAVNRAQEHGYTIAYVG